MTGLKPEVVRPEESSAYENPLIPNARLRQIYLAMACMRTLEEALPAARRARALGDGGKGHAVGGSGLEACLASTSVDLGPEDLVSDALAGGMVEFLRGAALGKVLGPAGDKGKAKGGGLGILAECGAAVAIPAGPGVAERLWSAVGAAAVVKARAMQARLEAKRNADAEGEEAEAPLGGVVLVYVRAGEVGSALLRRVLEHASKQELPMLFVVMPRARKLGGAGKAGEMSALALRCMVPGIAVDQDDAVAIYRVTQESMGRARAGGGAALMECVPFVLHGGPGRASAEPLDAIAGMERYLLQRGVVTKAWMEREGRSFARKLGRSG